MQASLLIKCLKNIVQILNLKERYAKRRIDILAPIWQNISEIHAIVLRDLMVTINEGNVEKIARISNDINEKLTKVSKQIKNEEFWFGLILFKKINTYLGNVKKLNYEMQLRQDGISAALQLIALGKSEDKKNKNLILDAEISMQILRDVEDKIKKSFLNIEDVIEILTD